MKTQNNIRGLFNIQQISHLSANNCQCPSWDCLCLPGQSRYDSLSLDCQILSLCSPRQAPVFIISCMSFFHRFLCLLCILLLMIALFHFHFLKFPSVIWFFQPHLVIFFFFFLNSSVSFVFSSHFCMHVTTVVAEVTQQNKWKKKKGVTMNSNSLEEEEKESAYFYLCFLVSILLPSWITYNICTPTELLWDKKGWGDRQRKRHMERRYRGGGRKGGQEETDESGFSPLIVTLKLFCVRAQFCRITYFVFLVCLPHSHILAKLLLSTLKYNANCHGNEPVGFHSLFTEAPKIDLPSKNYSPLIWEATQHGELDPWPKPVWLR